MTSKQKNPGDDRKARLSKALRDNLKRRKQVGKQLAKPGEGELATRKAALAPKLGNQDTQQGK